MARQYYKDSTTGQMKPIGVKVEDTLPIGFEGEIADGTPIPEGWVEVDDPNEYSTNETRIGTWIDGKPLYRKVYNCGELPNTTTKTINLEIENIDKVVRIYGEAISSTTSLPIPFMASNYIYVAVNNNTSLEIGTNADRRAYTGYVTIEYTKTTD